ncbi:MAG: M1 family aminopeptidase, partial [Acidobacteria bacterium]|nr:M1 family aminopeptidase [Acidobacteriota bacterium]
LYDVLKKEKIKDFVFTPERVTIYCDQHACAELLASSFTGLRPATRADMGNVLKNYYSEYLHNLRENRHKNGFSGFHLPYKDDRRNVTVVIKRANVDHRVGLDYDNKEPREVTFFATDYGPLFSYYSRETQNSGISSYDLEKRLDLQSRYYDLQAFKGTVELGIEESQRMRADVTFTMVTRMPLTEVRFNLARLTGGRSAKSETKDPRLAINSFQDGEGNELIWMKTGSVSGYVILPEELPAGSELTLRAQYINDDAIYRLTPSYAYLARTGWLPFVSFVDKIDDFDLTILSPSKFTTLAVGHIVEESKDGPVYTTRWKSQSPVTFPTVVYGNYVESKAGFDAKRANGDKIPVAIHVDRDNMRVWGIRPKQLRPLADDAANALNLYREMFGVEYPYARLDLVNDWNALRGQAPGSLIYLGSAAFRGEGALSDASLTTFVKSLVAHEVAHQWWGSLISNANDRNYWFVESLAEYSAALFVEARYGAKAYKKHVQAWRREILRADLRVSVQDAPILWSGRAVPRGAGYRAAVYAQGPYMFHILRNSFGDDKFFAFLKTLAQDLQGREIVTRDIQRVAEKAFNMNLEAFFDQWIRGVGLPEYKIQYKTRRLEDGNYMVEGTIHQHVLLGTKKEIMPDTYYQAVLRVTIDGKKGKAYAKTLVVDGPATEFQVKIPEEPRGIHFNERGGVLAHDIVMMEGAG